MSVSSDAESRSNLSRLAVQSTFWSYGSFVSGKLLVFISTVILARLLVPEQFGLMGFCLIAIQYLDVLNGFGVDSAVISRRDREEETANAAFVVAIATGVSLFVIAWFIAPVIAAFFNEAQVVELFRVLAIVIPLSALGSVPMALIQRGLRFKAKFIPDIGRSIAKGSVSIVLAWQGFGVWSLVIGQIAGELVVVIAVWVIARWRPTRRFDREVFRQILRYGANLIGVGITGALIINIDYLLVGKVLGAAALGYYTLAYRIPELAIRNTNFVIGRVAFPFLSRAQADADHLRSMYGSMLRYVALFTFPAGLGLALIAPLFIRTFYTETWEPAIVVMQLIALALAVSSIGHLPGVVYKAINRPEVLNKLSLAKLIVTTLVLGVAIRWDVEGVAAGQLLLATMFVTVDVVVVARLLSFAPSATFRAISPALAASLVMAAGVLVLQVTVGPAGVSGLVLTIVSAVAIYAGAVSIVSRETVIRARTVVRSALARA